MAFDKDQPAGSLQVRQVDDAIRTNNTALETALDSEHEFATGGNQTGHHQFVRASKASITGTALTTTADGRLLFANTEISGVLTPYVVESNLLVPVGPYDPWTRRTVNQDWTAAQYATRTAITPAGGPPLEFSWSLLTKNFFTATLTGDTIIKNPTDTLGASVMGSWTIQLLQNGTGGYVVTFDTAFLPAFGAQPAVDPAANSYTLLHITRLAKAAPNLVYTVQRCA